MKYSLIALAAASTALAGGHHAYGGQKHAAHSDVFAKHDAPSAPGGGDCAKAEKICTTYTTSRVYAVTKYYTEKPASTVTVAPIYESASYPVPTPVETVYPTPGVYTVPALTLTLEKPYTAVVPVHTSVTPGEYTYGGVTTIVKTSTTVTCPYATVETSEGTVTHKLTSTTYVCPTPGTYTVGASTTSIAEPTEITYPVPTVYVPGTYVHPEQTVTITKSSQVVYCPYETESPKYTPKPEAPKPEAPKYTPAKPEAPKPEAPKYTPAPEPEIPAYKPEKPKTKPIAKPETPKYPKAPSKPSGGSGLWSISYSPFNDDHSCKEATAIATDIADIAKKGFKNVRVYSTECDTLQNVGGAAAEHGMKLIVGIFFKGGVSSGDEQVADLLAWDQWSSVEMVVIGNESIFNGVCSAAELGAYIKRVGDKFRGAGYTGSITTTETLGTYQQPGVADALCPYMDVIGVNIQPYFDGGRTAEQAGDFMKSQLELTEKVCPGKTGYVLEAGWPSGGSCNHAACPGKHEQEVAVKGMSSALPGRVSFFTYRNDGWKEGGVHGIENKFGCGDVF